MNTFDPTLPQELTQRVQQFLGTRRAQQLATRFRRHQQGIIEHAAQLRQLAAALQSESLTPYRFLIAGHTDASGDADYNRRLSGRRAETVRRSLIDAGIDPKRLDARGFGEDELLDPANPRSGANRRVEIRNLGAAQP